jgi:Arc/MetJ-type ribon-helix-helix transcriptional regulator
MTVITVRLSSKEKASLEKYGKISDVIRQAIRVYLNDMNSREALKKLEQYQKKHPIATTRKEIVAMIREDRDSR